MTQKQGSEPLEQLVDKLLASLKLPEPPTITKLVGHRWPDDDVWLCCWMAKRFMPQAKEAEIILVNAGEALPRSDGNPSIIHFDTGGGQFDQHGKGLDKACSAELLAQALGMQEDPALTPLINMVVAVDNVEPLPATSIHYAIEGYPRILKTKDNRPDWNMVQERVFELFDIIYGQEKSRAENRAKLSQFAQWTLLPNNIRVVVILWHPELREAAFEQGAAVVVWTQRKGAGRFYTGIQTSRRYPALHLKGVAAELRKAEAKRRNEQTGSQNLASVGRQHNWFLHDSLHLVLNGSRTWKPPQDELTRLSPTDIVGMVLKTLGSIPSRITSAWKI